MAEILKSIIQPKTKHKPYRVDCYKEEDKAIIMLYNISICVYHSGEDTVHILKSLTSFETATINIHDTEFLSKLTTAINEIEIIITQFIQGIGRH